MEVKKQWKIVWQALHNIPKSITTTKWFGTEVLRTTNSKKIEEQEL